MRILDENDQEVTDPDLTLGHLEPDQLFVQHHDAIPEKLPVKEIDYDNPIWTGPNGGKLVETKIVSEYQPPVDAWDEYEPILRYILYTEEELAEIEAQKKAEEEAQKEAEEQAKREEEERIAQEKMQAAIASFSLLAVQTMDLSEVNDCGVSELAPLYQEWNKNGYKYKKGTPFTYQGRYFRVSQDTTSTDIYKPGDPGTESIYYEFFLADDGIIIWQQPKGEYNSYNIGDRCHYPDADSPAYESMVNGNVYSPEAYPDYWKPIQD